MTSPIFYVVAGPNGCGKSTFTRLRHDELGVDLIDPDAIALELSPDDWAAAAVAAGRETRLRITSSLAQRRSVLVETTLSGRTVLNDMRRAKAAGFDIDLHYFCLDDWRIARARIDVRVAAGGHDVATPDLKRRFKRSLVNLRPAIALSDRAYIYQTSKSTGPALIGIYHHSHLVAKSSAAPDWFMHYAAPEHPKE